MSGISVLFSAGTLLRSGMRTDMKKKKVLFSSEPALLVAATNIRVTDLDRGRGVTYLYTGRLKKARAVYSPPGMNPNRRPASPINRCHQEEDRRSTRRDISAALKLSIGDG